MLLALAAQGCALFPLAALGGAALNAGGGAITKGTEYTVSGTAHRTFTSPIDDVHRAILETFDRTGIRVERDESSEKGQRLVGEAEHRTVKISLTPLTPTLTSMTLIVKRNILMKDRATASELVEQTERALAETSTFAKRSPCDEERVASKDGAGVPPSHRVTSQRLRHARVDRAARCRDRMAAARAACATQRRSAEQPIARSDSSAESHGTETEITR
jgi:hypothetical protein